MVARARRVQDTSSSTEDHCAELVESFRWQVPQRFNIAHVCLQRWADQAATARNVAIIEDGPGWRRARRYTYSDLAQQANRLSNALRLLGVQRGDRVAIVLPQRFETAVACMAVRPHCPALRHVVGLTGAFDANVIDWQRACAGLRKRFDLVETSDTA